MFRIPASNVLQMLELQILLRLGPKFSTEGLSLPQEILVVLLKIPHPSLPGQGRGILWWLWCRISCCLVQLRLRKVEELLIKR